MSSNAIDWYKRPVTILQGICFAVFVILAIWLSPQITIGTRVAEYEFSNLTAQKMIVDKRVKPVEATVRNLENRVVESEDKIDVQLKDLHFTTRKLEKLMYRANPTAMESMAQDEATMARMKLQREQERSVIQIASPVINVGGIVNSPNGKNKDAK